MSDPTQMLDTLLDLETGADMDYLRQWAADWDPEMLRGAMDHMVLEGKPLAAIEAWHDKILELQADTPLEIIRKSSAGQYPPVEAAQMTKGRNASSPRYPSGIEAIDAETGGFYGLTVVGGQSGVGKSMLGIGSSLLGAMNGWRVFYGNAELKIPELSRRVGAFIGEGNRDFLSRWHCIDLFQGATLDKLVCEVTSNAVQEDKKILLVIDSLNSLVRKMGRVESGYFQAIDDVCAFAETCVRKSHGRVGVLLVSELSKHGGIKGGTTEYVCDFDIRMSHGEKQSDVTEIRAEKGREGGGYRNYGSYHPEYKTCSFELLDELPAPPPSHQDGSDGWEE